MKPQYINPNYYSLYNNLSPKQKKFSNIYIPISPVVIKTFGGNNYVYERKNNYNINNEQNELYDYIENDLKKSKLNKAQTTYTELSTQENMSIFSSQIQKTNKRCYKNYTNINNDENYFISPCKDNYFLLEKNDKKTKTYVGNNNNYRYNILKKEGISDLFIPKDKYYISPNIKNSKNHIELKSQRFCTSFISEKNSKDNQKNIFEIKYIKSKKIFPSKEIDLNISYNSNKRESSFSKSKNQLNDFNIDKLKEIGDSFAMKYLSRTKKIELKNFDKKNFNNSVNLKENKFLKNMMIKMEENRRKSKNRINMINNKFNYLKNNNIKNDVIDNKHEIKSKTPDKINNIYITKKYNKANKIKIIRMDKKNLNNIKMELPPNAMKIKLKHKIMGKQMNYNLNNNGDKGKKYNYYSKINNINNYNQNIYKTENKINYNNSPYKENLIQKIFDKKKVNSPQKNKDNKYNHNKKINITGRFKKVNLNIINHCYLESIDFKQEQLNKTNKTKHSFNNIFVPIQ